MSTLSVSPSWSALFRPPNRRARREDSYSPEDTSSNNAPTVRRAVSNSPFLGPPSWLFQSRQPVQTAATVKASSSSPPRHSRTPFLTVALLKLHDALPEFCLILGNNPKTQDTAARACALLDTSVATSTSPANSTTSTPNDYSVPRTQESSITTAQQANNSTRSRARSQSPVRRRPNKAAAAANQVANNRTMNSRTLHNRNPLWYSPRGNSNNNNSANTTTTPATPLLKWLTSSNAMNSNSGESSKKHHQHPSAVALESEWDYHVAPFTLLTAALILDADMQQCQQPPESSVLLLPSLYQRIAADLLRVQTTLCEPLMGGMLTTASATTQTASTSQSLTATSPVRVPAQAATLVSGWLESLVAYCTIRAELAEIEATLFSFHETTSLVETSQLVTALWQTVAVHVEIMTSVVQPLFVSLLDECKLWKYCLEACYALEQCQFYETIILLHKWKNALPSSKDTTRMAFFFRTAFRNVMALLPLYFDRIQAFAGPLYGFDPIKMMRSAQSSALTNDWNGDVSHFLRRQEKGGGPATAVALVLDALRTKNFHVQRGLQFAEAPTEDVSAADLEDVRVRWPAVYLRSTLYLGSPSSTQRPGARSEKEVGSSVLLNASQSNLLPNWAKSSPSSLAPGARKVPVLTANNSTLLEYDGVWPHNEWENLIALFQPDSLASDMTDNRKGLTLIRKSGDESGSSNQRVVSFRVETEESSLERLRNSVIGGAASLFDVGGTSPKSPAFQRSAIAGGERIEASASTFHIAPVSDTLSLVVIVKGEGDHRWHRRRSPLSDDEIRDFLHDMASKLRVSEQFSPKCISLKSQTLIQLKAYLPKQTSSDQVAHFWTDKIVDTLLKDVKDAFGLRPTQEGGTIVSRNSPGHLNRRFSPRTPGRPLPRVSPLVVSPEKSAAIFFMGPELATVVAD